MPATSVAQRKLFAIAEHHPEQLHKENKGLASLSKKTLRDFAAVPEKGLPEHVNQRASGMAAMKHRSKR